MDAKKLEEFIHDIEVRQIDEVEDAGLMYMDYAELARVAERGKSRAKRHLKAFDPGTYGGIRLVMARVNREYPDTDAIRATYAKLGLGPVPMKAAEPSLRVEFASEQNGSET